MAFLNILLGLILSFLIAALAYGRGSLSPNGVVGAILIGTVIFASGGLTCGLLLIAFFITSSALSHYQMRAKEPLAEKFQKGHRRDLGQVLANGGWGALAALAFAISHHPVWFGAFVGAMAAVNADTWATELGVLSRQPPRSIATGRVVAVGTSGGITLLGTGVALAGALLIGVLAYLFSAMNSLLPGLFLAAPNAGALVWVAAAAGLAGSLFDSLLGATVQAIYYCDYDHKETESARHRCGRATRLIRGWRWLDNDWVNFFASVFGSAVAAALYAAMF